jgi:hypothetical protein
VHVRVLLGQQHEVAGAQRTEQRRLLTAVLQRLVVGLRAAVQSGEHRAAGELEATAAELVAQLLGVGRQVAVGAQLDPLVAALHDLVEELVPRHLVRVVGEPDAPRVGRGAEAQP